MPSPDLDQLRSEAEAAIAAAGSAAELEELRVRYLGRKAELTATLRSIGELPADQRGPVGKAANEVKQELEGLLHARRRDRPLGLRAELVEVRHRRPSYSRGRTAPRSRPWPR